MFLYTLDGMIAAEKGKTTLLGEIVNALPDRFSDVFLFLGLAFHPGVNTFLGAAAVCFILLVSYTGVLSKALGFAWRHEGPAGKVDRLAALLIAIILEIWRIKTNTVLPYVCCIGQSFFAWLMAWYVTGSIITILNRLNMLIVDIRLKEFTPSAIKGVVIYESKTGNTKTIAAEIAKIAGFSLYSISEGRYDFKEYDIVLLGSPVMRGRPSKSLADFIKKAQFPNKYGLFATYGMPVWGWISTRMLFSKLKKILSGKKMQFICSFSCPGFHHKYKTYKNRPNEIDILMAKNFGICIAEKYKK
jgi:phosphatidylglycerophosphate synthase/flavodoxin